MYHLLDSTDEDNLKDLGQITPYVLLLAKFLN